MRIKKTIEAYQKKAKKYLINNTKIDAVVKKKAKDKLFNFIKEKLNLISNGSKVQDKSMMEPLFYKNFIFYLNFALHQNHIR